MEDSAKIAQNTTYLTIASIMQKAMAFIYFAFLAKVLDIDTIGQYQAVLGFCGIFIIFMDFGLGQVLTREAAKDESRLSEIFKEIFGLKLVLMTLSIFAIIIVTSILHNLKPNNYTIEDLFLIYLGSFTILLDTLIYTFFCVFRALKNLKYEALNILIYQTTIFCSGIIALIFTKEIIVFLLLLTLGSLLSFCYFLYLIKTRTNITFAGSYQYNNFKKILKIAAPFAITGIFVKLSGSVDFQMLKFLLKDGNWYVGLYTLPFKLTFALTVLSGSFASSYYPSVSYYLKHDFNRIKGIFENGIVYMLLLSIPIAFGVLILGDNIILSVWGKKYTDSIIPLQIYMAALIFIFINYPIGNLLNAANKQLVNTFNTGIVLVVNIAMNYLLIPKYNIIGACIAAFTSSMILVILGLPWVYKLIYFSFKNIFNKLWRILVSASVMAGTVYLINNLVFINNKISLLLYILIAIIIYFSCLFITKCFTIADFKSLLKIVKK